MVKRFLEKTYIGLVFIFLYAPIVTMIALSFNSSKSRNNWEGFTLKWYATMLDNPVIQSALYYTILVAVIASVTATIIGTAAAIGIHQLKKRSKTVMMNLTYIPVLNADIVTGVALMLLFVALNFQLGFSSMLMAHITFDIPYVILSVLPKLREMNQFTYEAALDLGATPFQALFKVIVPEVMPGIITGWLLAFTMSIDDFIISFFTTGNGVSNLSIAIYSMARRRINPQINALSTIMFIVVLCLLLLINKRTSIKEKIINR